MASLVSRRSNCRLALLGNFISTSAVSSRSLLNFKRCGLSLLESSVRHLHSRSLTLSNVQQHVVSPGPTDKDVTASSQDHQEHHETQNASRPWYLNVELPIRQSHPLLERQKIPDVPDDSLPLLQPLLNFISVELGLDDLTLLDLRHIDPPPALGANLIMLLGTVRSEKHLHVSAEQCCKWLKTKHQLPSHADGLIGRGELKVKLRRKARRAKLLSRVGTVETAPVDDGIRTGWICVHVPNVPDRRPSVVCRDLHEDYVGFDDGSEGVNIVIQMLTQEKREDLDLETLWRKAATRSERKEESSYASSNGLQSIVHGASSSSEDVNTPMRQSRDGIQSSREILVTHVQKRTFRTTAIKGYSAEAVNVKSESVRTSSS